MYKIQLFLLNYILGGTNKRNKNNMRVNSVKDNISFKSGYPTFGADGHLKYKPNSEVYDLIYTGCRPTGILKNLGQQLNYIA